MVVKIVKATKAIPSHIDRVVLTVFFFLSAKIYCQQLLVVFDTESMEDVNRGYCIGFWTWRSSHNRLVYNGYNAFVSIEQWAIVVIWTYLDVSTDFFLIQGSDSVLTDAVIERRVVGGA